MPPKKPKAGVTLNALLETEILPTGRAIRVRRAKALVPPIVEAEPAREAAPEREAALIYAENRLSPWAKWAKQHRRNLGFPTISLLYRAMLTTKVGIMRGRAADPEVDEEGNIIYPINADGHETRSFRPPSVGEIPEAIREVDLVVATMATLTPNLHRVIIAEYFTYGPMEERAKRTPWKLAQYRNLLKCAKYAVHGRLTTLADDEVQKLLAR